MSRYIDADAFLKKIERYSLNKGTTLGKHSGVADEIIDILKGIPVAGICVVSAIMKAIYPQKATIELIERAKEIGLW